MGLLVFANGETFATGAAKYEYAPATVMETTNRILLEVKIQEVETRAVVDTGAPYVICAPKIARRAGIDSTSALARQTMLVRGMRLEGFLVRSNMTLKAVIGQELNVDATVFVPEV